jgi:hypothetical protein
MKWVIDFFVFFEKVKKVRTTPNLGDHQTQRAE